MQSYEVWGKLSISWSTLGMSAKCKQFALPLWRGQTSDKPLKVSAKTDTRIKVRKAEQGHEFLHVLMSNLEFCTFVCRGSTTRKDTGISLGLCRFTMRLILWQ